MKCHACLTKSRIHFRIHRGFICNFPSPDEKVPLAAVLAVKTWEFKAVTQPFPPRNKALLEGISLHPHDENNQSNTWHHQQIRCAWFLFGFTRIQINDRSIRRMLKAVLSTGNLCWKKPWFARKWSQRWNHPTVRSMPLGWKTHRGYLGR